MKAKNYSQILKARGYKKVSETPDHIVRNKQNGELELDKHTYAKNITYEKVHLYYKVSCHVTVDTHGKAQEMKMFISTNKLTPDIFEFKKASADYGYLSQEAIKIYEAFETLKSMKAPKHLYCF